MDQFTFRINTTHTHYNKCLNVQRAGHHYTQTQLLINLKTNLLFLVVQKLVGACQVVGETLRFHTADVADYDFTTLQSDRR